MASPRIIELANSICNNANAIQDSLDSDNLKPPSFDPNQHQPLSKDLAQAQDAIIDATSELQDLLLPPLHALHVGGSAQNVVVQDAIRHFGFAEAFAPEETMTFAQLADLSGLSEGATKRILRYAMTMRIFKEPQKGVVAHTPRSVLWRDQRVQSFMNMGMEQMNPAALEFLKALEKWPRSEEPTQTGFSLAKNTDRPAYEYILSDPQRAKQFADSMDLFTSGETFAVSHVISSFDWQSLGEATIVDLGGSHGHISKALAIAFPSLKFVVQDLEKTIDSAPQLDPHLANRVSYLAHDFFKAQPVVADIYFIRWILHNWSDKYCLQILHALIPALRPGARVLINDTCMPEPGAVPSWRERELRLMDLTMQATYNSKERDADEWRSLLVQADPRFHLNNVNQPMGSALAMIEAIWLG